MPDLDSGAEEPLISAVIAGCTAALGRPVLASERFGVAVSGGPDSMALLALTLQIWPGRVEAATVDHGLRPQSGAEAAMVRAWCVAQGVPHAILAPDWPINGSLQAEARAVRYALLDRWRRNQRIDWVMTAHHADDQRETMVMRLNRGSGVGGLSGIRTRQGTVLRPLLAVRRAELQEFVTQRAIPHVSDPSNTDDRFDRARLRTIMGDPDWLDPLCVVRSAACLAEAEEALNWVTEELVQRRITPDGKGGMMIDPAALPRELLRRLLLHALAFVSKSQKTPRADTIDQAIVQLLSAMTVSIGDCLVSGGTHWHLRLAPQRRVATPRDRADGQKGA